MLTGPNNIRVSGINDKGDIVGSVSLPAGVNSYGVLLPANSTTPIPINYPGSIYTTVTGLNNSDEIIGYYLASPGVINGFTFLNGIFSTVTLGGNQTGATQPSTTVNAIDNSGEIGGNYNSANGGNTGFLVLHGSLVTFNAPGVASLSLGTTVTGLNDAGVAVGYYNASPNSNDFRGFIRSPDGTINTFFGFGPNNPTTGRVAINNNGIIVGSYGIPETDTSSGLVRVGQTDYSFDAPGAGYTFLTGINNSNRAIGFTFDPGNVSREFTVDIDVTPTPEPAALYLWGLGLFGLAVAKCRFSRPARP